MLEPFDRIMSQLESSDYQRDLKVIYNKCVLYMQHRGMEILALVEDNICEFFTYLITQTGTMTMHTDKCISSPDPCADPECFRTLGASRLRKIKTALVQGLTVDYAKSPLRIPMGHKFNSILTFIDKRMTANAVSKKSANVISDERIDRLLLDIYLDLKRSSSVTQTFLKYRLLVIVSICAELGHRLGDILKMRRHCITFSEDASKVYVDCHEGKNFTVQHTRGDELELTDDALACANLVTSFYNQFPDANNDSMLFKRSMLSNEGITTHGIRNNLKKYVSPADGISEFTFHSFRRSLAHRMKRQGYSLEEIKKLFAWKSDKMPVIYSGSETNRSVMSPTSGRTSILKDGRRVFRLVNTPDLNETLPYHE